MSGRGLEPAATDHNVAEVSGTVRNWTVDAELQEALDLALFRNILARMRII
jgi:hypothetical protein